MYSWQHALYSSIGPLDGISRLHQSHSSSRNVDVQHQYVHRDLVLLLCEELDWVVNLEKSKIVPEQVFAFVGIHYDLISFTAHPTLENWIKFI